MKRQVISRIKFLWNSMKPLYCHHADDESSNAKWNINFIFNEAFRLIIKGNKDKLSYKESEKFYYGRYNERKSRNFNGVKIRQLLWFIFFCSYLRCVFFFFFAPITWSIRPGLNVLLDSFLFMPFESGTEQGIYDVTRLTSCYSRTFPSFFPLLSLAFCVCVCVKRHCFVFQSALLK